MDDSVEKAQIPEYPVRVWEVILIVLGAIGLIGAAVVGLGFKMLSYAFDPARAEAIAESLMDYSLPDGATGVFGMNLGSTRFALVRSRQEPPQVLLFVGRAPITRENKEAQESITDGIRESGFSRDDVTAEFQAITQREAAKFLCGQLVSVLIEEGQQQFSPQANPVPAVRYTASLIENNIEHGVVLTVNGPNAKAEAETIFQSLDCR